MDDVKLTQLLLVAGLIGLTASLMFVVVPPQNKELFNMGLTAIISLISGGALGYAYRMKKEVKPEEKGEPNA